MRKPKILITIEWFDPAYKAGGPISSIVNLVKDLHAEYEFCIITGARDYGDDQDDPAIVCNEWQDWKGMATVYYVSGDKRSRRNIFNLLDATECDFYYIQGLFSAPFSVYPLIWWKQSKRGQAVIAPRGMLHSTALNVKTNKKRMYLFLVKIFGWFDDVIMHSSNAKETKEIKENLKKAIKIKEASNLPTLPAEPVLWRNKKSQELKILCVSRISPEKNILFLMDVLAKLEGNYSIGIAGPYSDEGYFQEFQTKLRQVTETKINYYGELKPDALAALFVEYDLFVFPSHGENFGHAIVEAMLNGLPCLIGDNVPWTDLEENKAGFNLPSNEADFLEKIGYYYYMDSGEFENARQAVRAYILSRMHLEETLSDYRKIFETHATD